MTRAQVTPPGILQPPALGRPRLLSPPWFRVTSGRVHSGCCFFLCLSPPNVLCNSTGSNKVTAGSCLHSTTVFILITACQMNERTNKRMNEQPIHGLLLHQEKTGSSPPCSLCSDSGVIGTTKYGNEAENKTPECLGKYKLLTFLNRAPVPPRAAEIISKYMPKVIPPKR